MNNRGEKILFASNVLLSIKDFSRIALIMASIDRNNRFNNAISIVASNINILLYDRLIWKT